MTKSKDPKPNSGRFPKGISGNLGGRPRKDRSVAGSVVSAMSETVVVNQNGKRSRVTLSQAAAKNMARRGAAGDARTSKMALDMMQKAEERLAAAPASAEQLSAADEVIVGDFLAKMKRIWKEEPSQ